MFYLNVFKKFKILNICMFGEGKEEVLKNKGEPNGEQMVIPVL